MCRWAAYLGEPIFLEEIVAAPSHSLIVQSHRAMEAKSPTNADGFGVAWYGDRPEPGLYRDILPAWSDSNLKSLGRLIKSGLFLAHVRASTGGATSRMNCHPFVSGRWSFMHNGQIGGFEKIRRALENSLSDDLFDQLEGTTDSELFFRLMIGEDLSQDPHGAASRVAGLVLEASRRAGIEPSLKLTAAFSDGKALHAVRYATGDQAPTLYTAAFAKGVGRCIVSEPFDRDGRIWHEIPQSSFVTMTRDSTSIRPFAPATPQLALAG
ncbi:MULTISPECIES: class II glutamine amidotransferase [unclassified Mesorhizobium]|uniref:class II glutamine amidotransferase n=2 Tax=Mesorhizobium TaxID=68287 RepID=UPI000BAEC3CE|nr:MULTISPECIES: class II glutamine amidotransferase [unclassified Mesorhizobium]TGT54287.1 class II glutamine amidotransferase [Mesorhizobium sp. M00.F.Ca.ET.170.01.1.1]AZO09995.1 class II glutamine amidotransferase [Mesorhizobium sp. M3A.F.Ca.ET.080.04.2.1]PBB86608.1 class II glutamine amidotransferase [Mesorhizobium sp. WSM3876]RWB75681.1 MAG: class II glutamine amidotransferase [Mesorhizobium sp.]RWB86532.1 MAG: class II glutamine amidotransferase [Mesorhizobium sp.]